MDWYKIAGIIFGVIAVGLIVYAIIGGNKGWQEENEPDPTKMPTPDDMERADKAKKSRSLASGGIAHGPRLGGEDRPETVVPPNKLRELFGDEKPKKSTGRFLSLLFLFLPVFGFSQWGNCEVVETYSDWTPTEGMTFLAYDTIVTHTHEWVYANHDDVNGSLVQVTLINCAPCPCGSTTKEARICRGCKFHQTRTRTTAYRNTESEYIQLLKEKEKQ